MTTQLTQQAAKPQHPVANPPATPSLPEMKPAGEGGNVSPAGPEKPAGGGLWSWLILAALGLTAWYFHPYWLPRVTAFLQPAPVSKGPAGPRVIPVVAAPVVQRDFIRYINGLGTITATNTVTVRSRVEGEVMKVAFTEGQMVRAGDLLVEIDPRTYQMQSDQYLAQIARDEATLKLAEVTLTRQLDLMKSQASTAQIVDQQVAQVDQAKAALQMDRAMLDTAKLQLEYCKITAPIDGRIGLRLVDKGNIIQANSATGIAVITQLEPISLVFTIPQDDIPRVLKQIKEVGQLSVEAFDRDFRLKLADGILTAIDNQVDSTTGTLKLKATFRNEDHSLFPNQFVNARLKVETLANALTVPNAALQRGPDKTFVYVVKNDDTVELRPVQLGPANGSETSILSGVAAGESVVTNGLDKLQPNAKVSLPGKGDKKGNAPGKPDAEKGAPQGDPASKKAGS